MLIQIYSTVDGVLTSEPLYLAHYYSIPEMTMEELDTRVEGDRRKWLETPERINRVSFQKNKGREEN